MNLFKTVFFTLIFFVPVNLIFGQGQPAEVDSTFENYINNAWQEIRDTDNSDSLQINYAREFYEYYKANPHSATSQVAIQSAFMMWGNTNTSDYVQEALKTLDYDSEIWGGIIYTLQNFFTHEEHKELMKYLSENLTDERGRSEAVLNLLRSELYEDEPDENLAIELARKLVEINATEFHVNQGLGYLHEFESLNIGQKAPDFEVATVDGKYLTLSGLEGRFVLLEFWATWCGPCIPEIPYLKTLHENYESDRFKIVGISLDRDKETLIDFINERELKWVQVYIEDGWEGEVPRLFNVAGIPRMYLLDPDGVIVARDLRGEEMVSKVESLLGE